MIRCKFQVSTNDGNNLTAYPVTSGSKENDGFWGATPCGKLEIQCTNDGVLSLLPSGHEFYLDLIPVEEEDPGY